MAQYTATEKAARAAASNYGTRTTEQEHEDTLAKAGFQDVTGLAAVAARAKKKREELAAAVQAKMNGDRVLKTGNPYEIARVKGKHVVRHLGGGKAKGTFDSYDKALRQFRLLEAIHHSDWKPGKKK